MATATQRSTRAAVRWSFVARNSAAISRSSMNMTPKSRARMAGSEAEAHGVVHRADVLGDRADGDEIDARLRQLPQALLAKVA